MYNNTITIVQEDYGVTINMNIINGTPSLEDSFLVTIKDGDDIVISKIYTNVTTYIPFSLTKEETDKLTPTLYHYSVDWYRDNVFLKNIVNGEKFIVQKKV